MAQFDSDLSEWRDLGFQARQRCLRSSQNTAHYLIELVDQTPFSHFCHQTSCDASFRLARYGRSRVSRVSSAARETEVASLLPPSVPVAGRSREYFSPRQNASSRLVADLQQARVPGGRAVPHLRPVPCEVSC